MSLEESIQDHAAAIRELAAAILQSAKAVVSGAAPLRPNVSTTAAVSDAELETAVSRVESDANAAQKRVMQKVEADRKPTPAEVKAEPAADLDYKKDVYPALVALGKKDRAGLTSLLEQFGVKSGDKLAPAQFADVIAAAQKLTAA